MSLFGGFEAVRDAAEFKAHERTVARALFLYTDALMVFRDKGYSLHQGCWQDTSTKDDVDDIVLSNTLHNFIEIAKAQKSQPEILYDQNAMIVWFERSKGKVRELLAFTMNPDIYGGAHKSHLKMKGQKDNSMEFSVTSLRHKKEPEAHH